MRATKTENGFSLIEMTIALMIIMAIAVPLVIQYQAWASKKKVDDTKQRAELIDNAISQFYEINRFYPCPANATLRSTHANFGLRQDCTTGANIISGAVPFKDIGLQEKDINDGWGRQFRYVVTRALANPNSLDATDPPLIDREYTDSTDGGITTITRSSQLPAGDVNLIERVPALLISHGETGRGARLSSTGGLYANCPSSMAVARERENCNNDTLFITNEAPPGSHVNDRSTRNNRTFFDDYVFLLKAQNGQIWRDGGNENVISNVPRLGVNTPNPMGAYLNDLRLALVAGRDPISGQPIKDANGDDILESGMDVNGNVQVDRATLAGQYCDVFGQNPVLSTDKTCFEAKIIAGEDGIKCDETEKIPMTGIAKNDAQCVKLSPLRTAGQCASGQYVIGFTPSGGILCSN